MVNSKLETDRENICFQKAMGIFDIFVFFKFELSVLEKLTLDLFGTFVNR